MMRIEIGRRKELTAAGLDDVTALPDHSDDGAAQHVYFVISMLLQFESIQ